MFNDNRDLAVGFLAIDADSGEELVFICNFMGLDVQDVPERARATNGRVYRLAVIRGFDGTETILAEEVLASVALAS